jgi:methyl-accepting chemotaxis protein
MTDEQVKIIAEAIKASGSEIAESIDKMSYDICEIKYSIHSLVESSRNTYTSTEDLGSINSTLEKLASSFKESTKIGGALWTGHR